MVLGYSSPNGLRHDLNQKVKRKDKKGRSKKKYDYFIEKINMNMNPMLW